MRRLTEVKSGTKYGIDGAFVGQNHTIGGLFAEHRSDFELGGRPQSAGRRTDMLDA